MQQNKNPWTIVSSTIKYDNNWIKVTEHKVINPSAGKGIYGIVSFKNYAIGIVALDAYQNIYLVGQYRLAINQYSWEIPEGGGNLAANPLVSAKRELLEETGLVALEWKEILRIHLSNSVTDELSIIYLAQNLEQHEPQPEETEQLQIQKIPFNDAYAMVENNTITDAISVAAILKIKLLNLGF
jgi:8-oxo-dGDP phosphatase